MRAPQWGKNGCVGDAEERRSELRRAGAGARVGRRGRRAAGSWFRPDCLQAAHRLRFVASYMPGRSGPVPAARMPVLQGGRRVPPDVERDAGIEQRGIVGGPGEVHCPHLQAQVAGQAPGAVAAPGERSTGARSSRVGSITAQVSSLSLVQERRLKLSDPQMNHTSSTTQVSART
jgi:hypothetical protein